MSKFSLLFRLVPLALVLAIVVSAWPAHAQVSFGATAGSGATTIVDEQQVLDNAREAFRLATGDRLVSVSFESGRDAEARELVRKLTAAFVRQLRLQVNELKGDGVLDAGEVAEEIGKLRDDYLNQVEIALDALGQGYPAPPRADEFDSRMDHAAAMARYTLTVRNDAYDWLVPLGAIGGAFLGSWLAGLALRRIGSLLRGAGRRHTAQVVEGLTAPLYLAAIALALQAAFNWIWVPGIAGDLLARLVDVALMGAVFWFVWNACVPLAHGLAWLLQKTYGQRVDRHVVLVVSRALRLIALVVFVLVLVNGVLDSDLTGLIAGLGVIGVALSFVLRGTIQNVAASFTIFGDKPFRVGDLIVYDDKWGRIEDIGFRSTRFRTLSGHLITIPNAQLVDNALHNVGARPSIRRRFRIGLPYSTPPEKVEQAIEILRDLLADHDGQPAGQPPHVAFEGYGEYQLKLLVQYYYEPADYWQALAFDTELNLAIMRRFCDAGIEFAFPTRTLYMHAGDDDFAFVDRSEAGNDSLPAASKERGADSAASAQETEPQEAA